MNRTLIIIALTLGGLFQISLVNAADAPLRTLQLANLDTECTAFSPDGKLLAVAFNNDLSNIAYKYGPLPPTQHLPQEAGIGIWDVTTGQQTDWLSTKSLGRTAKCVRFTPDGSSLGAVGIDYDSLFLWNLETKDVRRIKLTDTNHVLGYRFEFLNEGQDVAVTDSVGRILVYELESQDILHEFAGSEKPESLRVTPSGRYLASRFRLWSLDDDQLVREYDHHAKSRQVLPFSKPDVVAVSPQGNMLFGIRTGRRDTFIHGWRLSENRITYPFLQAIKALEVQQPDNTGRPRLTPDRLGTLMDLAISPSGTLLATADLDRQARLWHIPTQRCIASFEAIAQVQREESTIGHATTGLHDVEFSPDGKHLLTLASDGDINLWDVTPLNERATSELHLVRFWAGTEQIQEPKTTPVAVQPSETRPSSSDVVPGGRLIARAKDGRWYPACVMETRDQGKARIHFTGTSNASNLTVTRTQLRLPPTKEAITNVSSTD